MIVPVILCGGAGTRLWPISREDAPKPFIPFIDGRTTFAMTLERVADPARYTSPIIVAGSGQRRLVEEALKAAGVEGTIMLEPDRRDTAAALTTAAIFAAARDPDAMMLVLPADHVVRDRVKFSITVATAAPTADEGYIVVFGLKPTYPATGFGYIQVGEPLGKGLTRSVRAFVEKPDIARAEQFVADGLLWNSGIFLMRASTALAEVAAHAPDVFKAAEQALAKARADGNAVLIDPAAFAAAPRRSFDYAVMEKTGNAAVIAADFDWSDVGTWAAVWEVAAKNEDGNVLIGDAYAVDSRNAYIATDTYRVGVAGIDDAVVVASAGALLVTTQQHAGSVKDLVAAMEKAPEKAFGDFVRHFRPWGYYQSLDQGEGYQVKRIVVNPGARLSLQMHRRRAERWTVVQGSADVTVGTDKTSLVTTRVEIGGHVKIPKGAIHRVANPGTTPLAIVEVQLGDYLGEDDIIRLEDDYGR